ncbi:UNVERIFIED_CONTAM: hypothetical protein FKN15_027653 [Acipenser sinensis]
MSNSTASRAFANLNGNYELKGSAGRQQKAVTVDGVTLNGPLSDNRDGERFLEDAFQIIMNEAVKKGTDVTEKVCDWKEPGKLREMLDLELRETGENHERLLQRCHDVAKYSVKTSHPRFFNQLFAGLDHHSLAGRFLTEALNSSQYTYEVAPVFVLMEEAVLSTLRSLIGWDSGDGIFCPGGSISNLYAMNLARYRAFPEVKQRGLWAVPRLAVFTSKEVAPTIKERMVKKGSMMVGYQPHQDKVNFFRMVVISPQITRADLDFFLDEIESLGRDL